MSTTAAKNQVLEMLFQTCRTLRSGGNVEIAIAAAETERDLQGIYPDFGQAPQAPRPRAAKRASRAAA